VIRPGVRGTGRKKAASGRRARRSGGLFIETGDAEPAGKRLLDLLEREVAGGQQHQQMVQQVGRLRDDPVVGLAAGSLDKFRRLLRHFPGNRRHPSGKQPGGVGSRGIATLPGDDHLFKLLDHGSDSTHSQHPLQSCRDRPGPTANPKPDFTMPPGGSRPPAPTMPVAAPQLADDCLILTGPTATGKSAVALKMAEQLDAEILSVDSIAVYRTLDIGSAKPDARARGRVPHHLLDLVAASETFSVADWLAAATAAVADCRRRGRRMLFVGGTPLYLRCLRDGLDALPPGNPAVRAELLAEAADDGAGRLHQRLAAAAPQRAREIHPRDTRRIVRALEILETGGRLPAKTAAKTAGRRQAAFPCPLLVLDLPRRLLAERIDRRAAAMFAAGLLDETRAALGGGGISPTAAQAAGYAEALACLRGELTERQAIDRTARRTRQLAKRQRTWLRSFADAVWVSG